VPSLTEITRVVADRLVGDLCVLLDPVLPGARLGLRDLVQNRVQYRVAGALAGVPGLAVLVHEPAGQGEFDQGCGPDQLSVVVAAGQLLLLDVIGDQEGPVGKPGGQVRSHLGSSSLAFVVRSG
jgi:hypothetical protein